MVWTIACGYCNICYKILKSSMLSAFDIFPHMMGWFADILCCATVNWMEPSSQLVQMWLVENHVTDQMWLVKGHVTGQMWLVKGPYDNRQTVTC
jgi:hypothetical protein